MKLRAILDQDEYEIDLVRENDNVVNVTVDGREYALDATEPESGVLLIKHEGRVYELFVSEGATVAEKLVTLGSMEANIRILDPKRLRVNANALSDLSGPIEIRAVMPGKVVRLMSSEGSVVEKGDGILVVEAMKMQNEVRAPKSGTIVKILVTDGATVATGDVLVTIE